MVLLWYKLNFKVIACMPSDEPFVSQGMRIVDHLFSAGTRIFTTEEAKRVALLYQVPIDQVNKILANLTKRKLIVRLRRGLYVAVGLLPKQLETHSFIISAFLVQPSMISHWSALQYHGLTEQIPQAVTASTPRKIVTPSMREKNQHPDQKHAWEINHVRYEYMTILEKNFFGFDLIWPEQDLYARITDKERTLLDLFIYPQLFGGIGEALGILENAIASLDIKKLVEYAIKYDKKSVIKRLGWALAYFGVSKKQLAPLLKTEINYYCRLDSSKPAVGGYDKEWMIQNNLKG